MIGLVGRGGWGKVTTYDLPEISSPRRDGWFGPLVTPLFSPYYKENSHFVRYRASRRIYLNKYQSIFLSLYHIFASHHSPFSIK